MQDDAIRHDRGQRPEARGDPRLDWWRDAKFGLFIHWGLYAIPAGVWQGQEVQGIGEWIMQHARIPVHEYEPLALQFNPVHFDAATWVSLAKAAGQKYLVITSKHHDGFCLFDSRLTDYKSTNAPCGRDLVRDFVDQEYTSFPVSHHDDMMDCLARITDPDLNAAFPKIVKPQGAAKRRRTRSAMAA